MKINTPNISSLQDCQRMFNNLKSELDKNRISFYTKPEYIKAQINEKMYDDKWDGSFSDNRMIVGLVGNRCFIDGYLKIGELGTTGTNNTIYISFPFEPSSLYYGDSKYKDSNFPFIQGIIKHQPNSSTTNNGFCMQSRSYDNCFYMYDDGMNSILDYSDIDFGSSLGVHYSLNYFINEDLL